MVTFLLVIMLMNGDYQAAVKQVPPFMNCEELKAEVLAVAKDYNAKILKAECIVIQDS